MSTIIDEIAAHIQEQGSPRSSWYVGITSDIKQRLHGDHCVPEKNHWFIHRNAQTADKARSIEKSFLDWGCDGGGGGGGNTSKHVYAYLKTSITDP